MDDNLPSLDDKNVLLHINENVPIDELGQSIRSQRYILKKRIEDLAIEKYRYNGEGITFEDIRREFLIKKSKAQRSLKYFHAKGVLFTGKDLRSRGIELIRDKNPQQYFPSSIKPKILEDLKRRKNVLVQPTEVTHSKTPPSNILDSKAQTFLDVLYAFDVAILYIHKLQLELFINPEGYKDLNRDLVKGNKAKLHEERIGKAYVKYLIYPNGKVMVYIACSDNPFKLN